MYASEGVRGRLPLDAERSFSLSFSFSRSPNQENGMQEGMEEMEPEGETLLLDSSSNSPDPLSLDNKESMLTDLYQRRPAHFKIIWNYLTSANVVG